MRVTGPALRQSCIVGLMVVMAAAVGGCTPSSDPGAGRSPSGTTPTLSRSPSVVVNESPTIANCADVAPYPELPVWELNESLPVVDIGIEYIQTELMLERGPGDCEPWDVAPILPECELVDGAAEELGAVVMWRSPELLTERLFADGANAALYENVSARATDGEVFRYRLSAWSFDSEAEARGSLVIQVADSCGALKVPIGSQEYSVLDVGAARYFGAAREGSVVRLVELWIGRPELNGGVDSTSVAAEGLLPVEAFEVICGWWAERTRAGEWPSPV